MEPLNPHKTTHFEAFPSELTDHFARFDGSTLEWITFNSFHGGVWLRALRGAEEFARLCPTMCFYYDCPTRMTDVRLRLAKEEEHQKLPRGPSSDEDELHAKIFHGANCMLPPAKSHLVIEAAEGVFHIWGMLILCFGDDDHFVCQMIPAEWPEGLTQ